MRISFFPKIAGLFFIIFSAIMIKAGAVPACPSPIELAQPNGETVTAYVGGDEKYHYLSDEDGYILEKNAEDYYVYVTEDESAEPALSSVTANENGIKPLSAITQNELSMKLTTGIKDNSTLMQTMNKSASAAPAQTKIPLLVLMVEYSNMKLDTSNSTDFWKNRFFGLGTGSVNDYYNEVSNAKLQYKSVEETQNIVDDGIIKVSLDKPHPEPEKLTGNSNVYAIWQIVKDAVTEADAYVDFSTYDTDGNGYISSEEMIICLIVAGYETARTEDPTLSVWAHQYLIPEYYTNYAITADNKKIVSMSNNDMAGETIGAYIMAGERWGYSDSYIPLQIGVLCHELAHCLGVPDLYDTTNKVPREQQVGVESLMSRGSWAYYPGTLIGSSPTHLDPLFKSLLGWIKLEEVTDTTQTYTVTSVKSVQGYKAYLVPTSDKSEFFIVENRQMEGFDKGLVYGITKGGIAIWHIDKDAYNLYISSNSLNVYGHSPAVMIEKCGKDLAKSSITWSADPMWYSRASGYNSFTKFSSPSNLLNSGYLSNSRINVLSPSGQSMNFSLSTPDYEMVNAITTSQTTTTFINNTQATVYTMPIISIYNNSGQLLHVFTQNLTLKVPYKSMSPQTTVTYSAMTSDTVKITYWKSLTGMKPLLNMVSTTNLVY